VTGCKWGFRIVATPEAVAAAFFGVMSAGLSRGSDLRFPALFATFLAICGVET
jgi:hypothetical protein